MSTTTSFIVTVYTGSQPRNTLVIRPNDRIPLETGVRWVEYRIIFHSFSFWLAFHRLKAIDGVWVSLPFGQTTLDSSVVDQWSGSHDTSHAFLVSYRPHTAFYLAHVLSVDIPATCCLVCSCHMWKAWLPYYRDPIEVAKPWKGLELEQRFNL